jgi:hypothetical protein
MIGEFLFNIFLFLISVVCFVDITLVAPAPVSGNINAAQWPQVIFGLLGVCLIFNMIWIWKNSPLCKSTLSNFKFNIEIINKKLSIAFFLLIAFIFLLNYIGFIPGSLLFCSGYMVLLGERKLGRIVIPAFLIVLIIYCVFINLEVMLPRGISVYRTFHLFMESVIRV